MSFWTLAEDRMAGSDPSFDALRTIAIVRNDLRSGQRLHQLRPSETSDDVNQLTAAATGAVYDAHLFAFPRVFAGPTRRTSRGNRMEADLLLRHLPRLRRCRAADFAATRSRGAS